jgi:amino acid adenylation domain-containing protein
MTKLSPAPSRAAASRRAVVTPAEFRTLMASFPSGVTIVTAAGGDGRPHGMTCSSLCSVAMTPPTLLVCLRDGSPTLDAVLARAAFTVNLLHGRARPAADLFASGKPDRFDRVTWRHDDAAAGPHLIEHAHVIADCDVSGTALVGDHVVVFGTVVRVSRGVNDEPIPLLYGLRQYSSWAAAATVTGPDAAARLALGEDMTSSAEAQPRVGSGIGRLADAVSKWAEHSPAQTAVWAADGSLTFAELADRTRAIAGELAAAGVGPGTPVALFSGRSRLALPSLLAVWWLGATAVLIDERHPAERLLSVLQDAGARTLVAGAGAIPDGAQPPGARTINPDVVQGAAGASALVPAAAGADDCAYIVFTSGTTGQPKGVEVTYRNLETFLDALATLHLTPGGMGINAVSPAFDGWLSCTLLYLLYGQGMAIIDLAARDNTAGLSELVEAHSPRTMCLTPTLLSALERIPSADVIVVAGEPCPPALVARLAGTPRVLNIYGPTETTIAATWADSARGDDPVTIGRALPGYRVYILDEDRQPARAGAVGELYIGGPAVARGYRNRPDLTAERFSLDPFAGDGSRMYRSGDLARSRPDGQIEYWGRVDEQIKVRGFRVELGEIEQVAMTVDAVQAAAAFKVASTEGLGLAVTTAPGTDRGACVASIRDRLAARLPYFMVPATVEVVSALPALPTGKVDRAALARTAGTAVVGQPPSTERERLVCEAWTTVLSRPVNDVQANFFELGGHSLLAARAVGALRSSTGLPLSVRHLLTDPTPTALARELDLLAQAQRDSS